MKKQDMITKIFLGAVIICIILQGTAICYSLFFNPPGNWQDRAIQLIQILTGLGYCSFFIFLKQFQKIIDQRIETGYYNADTEEKANYISSDLNTYIKHRVKALSEAECNNYPQVAMSACLDFLLSFLKSYDETALFETSIFASKTNPDIICYADSAGNPVPSTKGDRMEHANFYRDQEYEAVKYLDNASDGYVVDIKQFRNNSNYSKANSSQKERVKDQIFHCFESEGPHVLVVTCNKENLFKNNEENLRTVIGTIGLLLKSELILKKNFCCVRCRTCTDRDKLGI